MKLSEGDFSRKYLYSGHTTKYRFETFKVTFFFLQFTTAGASFCWPITWLQISASGTMFGKNKRANRPRSPSCELGCRQTALCFPVRVLPVGEVGGHLHHLTDGVWVGACHGADIQTAVAILLHLQPTHTHTQLIVHNYSTQ